MILDDIVQHKLTEIERLDPIDPTTLTNSNHDFIQALNQSALGIIAEIKAKSPSAGTIRADFDPAAIAKHYQSGGANCISVLTDEKFFGGNFDYLTKVRTAVELPLLCKDFILDKKQIHQARHAGADACLLICAILDDQQLADLKQEIEYWNMAALIEVFDEQELTRALAVDAKLIDINNRNLKDFTIDMDNTRRLCAQIPEDVTVISASGIEQPADVADLPNRVDGVLIGSALMRSDNPANFIQSMRQHHEN